MSQESQKLKELQQLCLLNGYIILKFNQGKPVNLRPRQEDRIDSSMIASALTG
jgi:hypothetical protein